MQEAPARYSKRKTIFQGCPPRYSERSAATLCHPERSAATLCHSERSAATPCHPEWSVALPVILNGAQRSEGSLLAKTSSSKAMQVRILRCAQNDRGERVPK